METNGYDQQRRATRDGIVDAGKDAARFTFNFFHSLLAIGVIAFAVVMVITYISAKV